MPIWSARPLTDADYGRIRAAKQRLNLPFLVQFGRAVEGTWERVLAIGGDPPILCDYASVPHTTSAGLDEALAWVLGDHEDARAMTMADVLSKWLGGKVTEVTDADEQSVHSTAGVGGVDSGTDQPDFGPRGRRDPGNSDERPYRNYLREVREVERTAAQVGK